MSSTSALAGTIQFARPKSPMQSAKAYITDQLNAKFEANRTATLWLQQRIQQLGDQAETAERAVNAYKTQHNIVSSEGKSVDEQQITRP